ncbi:Asp23/Gls24 family envelope stress response protein [Lacticaseibacillus daqingensis]|uniref:Asp23/Gls24 family envelope stress response protein n=1 Tax=Lacticaseibacillus daqingensis TaxID=2486014 RepID=UPI000F77A89C|nr:Asp23/Gls24 family envelope stress response protein [Lacticaseibacillus daqingensis]
MQSITDTDLAALKANSRLTFDDYVIQKIAGICAQHIEGLLEMDGNMVDKVSETLGRDERITKGIKVEVGEKQVAIDMTAVIEYDVDAQRIFDALRAKVAQAVERMTGLQVVELNLHVSDVMTRRDWQKTTRA